MIIVPPEAPTEGRNSNLSKVGGAEISNKHKIKKFLLGFL
jgi:hypothetical protein